jgi:hypothetical protein
VRATWPEELRAGIVNESPYVTPAEEDALFEAKRKQIETDLRKQYEALPNRYAKRVFLAKLKRSPKVSRVKGT